MEFDQNLLLNFVSIFLIILLIFVTCIVVFHKLKFKWPIKVNCWFCNNNTKIWRQERDWWLCPSCEQYNGFSKDGDYLYDIPEQYSMPTSKSAKYCTNQAKVKEIPKANFCKECNKHEDLKLIELLSFEPKNERSYNSEIKQLKDSLEKKYPLCSSCNRMVQNALIKQALWLTRYKMQFFKRNILPVILKSRKRLEILFRIIVTIFVSITAYNSELLLLPIGGLIFQLCAYWATRDNKKNYDILLSFLWICIIMLTFSEEYKLRINLNNDWVNLECLTQYRLVLFFIFIIGIINIIIKSNITISNKTYSFKKIENNTRDSTMPNFFKTEETITKQNFKKNNINNSNKTSKIGRSSINIMDTVATPLSMDFPITTTSTTDSENSTASQVYPLLSTPLINHSDFECMSPYRNTQSETCAFDDNLNSLSALSLDENLPKYTLKTPKIFEKRVYSTLSPDLFKKSNNMFNKKNILSPPKLKSVMQASWVAGGYWQEGMDAPSLSRSSSQSSGFGSMGSNCVLSREPSVNDFDQCSVVSDATLSSYTFKQNCTRSAKHLLQQTSSFSFVRPKPLICDQSLKLAQNRFPQQVLLTQQFHKNNTVSEDQYIEDSRTSASEIKNPGRIPMYPGYTTVVTSPSWLSALLCGSLILNMIVLCTTLLR